ncbi:MAG: hypothetical protein Q9216_000480 [Gyalolechia sp. 2 TL-2023]
MAFGKLFTYDGNARSTAIRAVAKANKLDLEIVKTVPLEGVSQDYLKINPLGRIPSFVGADGYTLTECMAIAIYITSQNEKTSLLGKTKQDYASIVRWMSFANTEVLPNISNWFRPCIGRDPFNKKSVEDAKKAALQAVKVLEEHLWVNTFLVGERLSLADLFAAGAISRGFQYFFDKKWRQENPNVTRWYETVCNQPIYAAVVDELSFIDEAIKEIPPKKEKEKEEKQKKDQIPKTAPKPKAKEVDEEEEEDDKPAPKPKHPLEALPKPALAIDEWKRKYSNEETREVALPWFWENFNPEEYSLWKISYKYNDELTQTFMSSNLITGFFTRLDASRKYLFGCASVYGKANDSVIQGAFMVRGQEAHPAFDVAPDIDSYEFTKLEPSKDKEFVNDMWAWDKPLEVNGKTYEFADGKIFK